MTSSGRPQTFLGTRRAGQDLVISKALERGEGVHAKFSRELRNASGQRYGNQRLYKLDLRRCHLTDDHVSGECHGAQDHPGSQHRLWSFGNNGSLLARDMQICHEHSPRGRSRATWRHDWKRHPYASGTIEHVISARIVLYFTTVSCASQR